MRVTVENRNNRSRHVREDACSGMQKRSVRGVRAQKDQIAAEKHREYNHFRLSDPQCGICLVMGSNIAVSSVISFLPWKGKMSVYSADGTEIEIVK